MGEDRRGEERTGEESAECVFVSLFLVSFLGLFLFFSHCPSSIEPETKDIPIIFKVFLLRNRSCSSCVFSQHCLAIFLLATRLCLNYSAYLLSDNHYSTVGGAKHEGTVLCNVLHCL